MLVCCGSRSGDNPKFAEEARSLGLGLGEAGYDIITGGSGDGLMGAVADGALEAGSRVTGFVPAYLAALQPPHPGLERTVIVDSMAERKTLMFETADACVALPGAIGTMDEILESIVLQQLKQITGPMILLDVDQYWQPMFDMFARMTEHRFFPDTLDSLVVRVDSAQAAVLSVTEKLRTPGSGLFRS